jgi:hypothetical protein
MPRRHRFDHRSGPEGGRAFPRVVHLATVLRWRRHGARWAAVLCGVLLMSFAFGAAGTSAAEPAAAAQPPPADAAERAGAAQPPPGDAVPPPADAVPPPADVAGPAAAQPPPADPAEPDPGNVAAGVAAPADAAAPPNYQPVIRNGNRPQPKVTANRGGFSAATPVNFPDGVSVKVDKVAQGVEQGEGPGVFRGRPHSAFTLSLTNGSTGPIDLTQVVVTTTYGSPAKLASPVYGVAAAADFTGTVAPGATATATYVFAIPPGQAKSTVMTVDFDDVHAAATLTGSG